MRAYYADPDLPSIQPSVSIVVQPSDTLSVTAHDQPSIHSSVVHNWQAMVQLCGLNSIIILYIYRAYMA